MANHQGRTGRPTRKGLKTSRKGLKTSRKGLKTRRKGLKTSRKGLKTSRKARRQAKKAWKQAENAWRQTERLEDKQKRLEDEQKKLEDKQKGCHEGRSRRMKEEEARWGRSRGWMMNILDEFWGEMNTTVGWIICLEASRINRWEGIADEIQE
jgi:hypothetical protein